MFVKSDVRSIKGYNDVCGAHIVYNIDYKMNEEPSCVVGRVEVDEESVGTVNIYRSGKIYVSIKENSGLSATQQSEIISTILADVDSVFNPVIETTVDESATVETTNE